VNTLDFSPVAVTFQAIGTLLLAFMLQQLGKNFAWRYASNWATAWLAMFLAIGSVRVYITTQQRWTWVVYLVAQWTFLVLLYAGCREVTDHRVHLRHAPYALPFAIAVATLLALFTNDFNRLFIVEAAVVAFGALASFHALARVTVRTTGWQLMRLSLVLLGILYFAYVPLYAAHTHGVTISFLQYSSLADLLGEVLLGFSMVLVASEDARRELQDAVQALQTARDQLEIKLKTDPLTEALTRHAFHAMPSGITGVVAMIDVDSLKQINDEHGHAAGDLAIRAVANAVRARIRADDLLFRWGGDEFLVVVPNSTLEMVRERLGPLTNGVQSDSGHLVRFSWGAAQFGGSRSVDDAMRDADAQMYSRRASRRSA
jgi:diguanylate cyclase (GGDEF)-like protein